MRHFQEYCYPLTFDLHVLSTPPAFILSQDQTLHKELTGIILHDVLLIESSKSLSQFDYCLTTLQLLMCSVPSYFLHRFELRFSLPLSAGARVYFTTALPACQIRLPLLRFISSALWRLAHPTWQLGRHTDSHHFHDALRYKSSSYNIWTRTANLLDSVFLNVLCLSQCLQTTHSSPLPAACSRQAQERRLSLPLPPSQILKPVVSSNFSQPVVLTTWREKSRQNNSQEALGLLPVQPAYGQYTGN